MTNDSADDELPDIPEYQLSITSKTIESEVRQFGKHFSAVDRLAALGRGEPDPGAFQPTLISHESADDLRALFEADHSGDA